MEMRRWSAFALAVLAAVSLCRTPSIAQSSGSDQSATAATPGVAEIGSASPGSAQLAIAAANKLLAGETRDEDPRRTLRALSGVRLETVQIQTAIRKQVETLRLKLGDLRDKIGAIEIRLQNQLPTLQNLGFGLLSAKDDDFRAAIEKRRAQYQKYMAEKEEREAKLTGDSPPSYDPRPGALMYDLSQIENALNSRLERKSIKADMDSTEKEIRQSELVLSNLDTTLQRIDDRIQSLLQESLTQGNYVNLSTGFFAVLVGLVIAGFFYVSFKSETVRNAIFAGESGIQFVTLFSLVIAIILFGVLKILEGKELAALLGGLSGYILGRGSHGQSAPPANPPPAPSPSPNPNPAV